MSYFKTLVVDLDDTISFTTNRDFENATPNKELITKLNELYNSGWTINILTARGRLSCKSLEEREQKYRIQIEDWLNKNGVLYNSLSFEKPLATYYIDDKAIKPEQFLETDFVKITGGWSNAELYRIGEKVFKTHPDSISVVEWYKNANDFFYTPEIYSLIGQTISMEYIKPSSQNPRIELLKDILLRMSTLPSIHKYNFKSYIERVVEHVNLNKIKDFEFIYQPLLHISESEEFIEYLKPTFCHGDFSEDNIVVDNSGKHFLIDPINKGWGNWILDATKLLYSYRRDNKKMNYEILLEFLCVECDLPLFLINVLEATQWIRVYKYAPEHKKESIIQNFNKITKGND